MQKYKAPTVAMLLVVLCAFSHQASAEQPRCPFKYTSRIQNEVVIPALKKFFMEEDEYLHYNYESPLYRQSEGKITITLGATKSVNGHWLWDEGDIILVLDECTLEVLQIYAREGPPRVKGN